MRSLACYSTEISARIAEPKTEEIEGEIEKVVAQVNSPSYLFIDDIRKTKRLSAMPA